MNEPNFWNDKKSSEKVISELNSLKSILNNVLELKNKINSNLDLINILKQEEDQEIKEMVEMELAELEQKLKEVKVTVLLDGPYDKENAIIEIHPGAGGTESCDWASMLYRMYLRYFEKKGYKVEIIDEQAGEEAGIKSVSMIVKGTNAYGYLKCEKGVHRLIRISPFDSNSRRHTSFASVNVTPLFDNERITHIPSKIVVTCQNERSQIQNKEKAMEVLKNKLYKLELEKREQELKQIKGENSDINFGSQIRSYVMHPYSMVKDHRTNIETSNVEKVLDGDIDLFINEYLMRG